MELKIYRDSETHYDAIEYTVEPVNIKSWNIPGDWEQPADNGFEYDVDIRDVRGNKVSDIKLTDRENKELDEMVVETLREWR